MPIPFARKIRKKLAVLPEPIKAIVSQTSDNMLSQIRANYEGGFMHDYDEFRRLITALRCPSTFEARPVCRFLDSRREAAAPVIGVRIDVDADPWTAVKMGRDLASVGVPGTVYLLHTAAYYGMFEGDLFIRNNWMPGIIRDLVVSGVEIGLHQDSMGLAQAGLVDPAAAVMTEIQWLSSHGAFIRGTAGHNSVLAYGAENSELFQERVLAPASIDPRRSSLPIGKLSEAALNLQYEGTFAKAHDTIDKDACRKYINFEGPSSIRDEGWMRTYLAENPLHGWKSDYQAWALGGGKWVLAGRFDGRELFEWNIRIDQLIELLRSLGAGSRTLVVLHPEYFRV